MIQLAFVSDSGQNYLLKMRDDTLGFNKLEPLASHFNFSEVSCDPFLIQTSVLPKSKISVGGGVRSLQQRKKGAVNAGRDQAQPEKIIIPLDDSSIQKAKACQEMIMFEREGNGQTSL